MNKLQTCVALASLLLSACGETSQKAATPAAPATVQSVIPGATIGGKVEYRLGLLAGDMRSISGETATAAGQSWNDPSGKEYSIAPPPGFAVGPSCIFVVVSEDKTPIVPLQPVVVDKLEPCYLESSFSTIKLSGTVVEVRDVQLVFNSEIVTLKAPVLTNIDFVTPLPL
jgi:hypothetical protein